MIALGSIGSFISEWMGLTHEGLAVFLGFIGLFIGIYFVQGFAARKADDLRFQPVMLLVIS